MVKFIIRIFSLFILCFFIVIPVAFSSLSATTANVIHGNAPVMQNNALDNLEVKLYLVLDDDNSFVLTPKSDIYYIGANTQFGQIVAKVETDNNTLLSYFNDSDGDQISEVNITSLSYSWKKNGTVISSFSRSDSINTDACSTGTTNDSYLLTVSGEVKAKTSYGLPYESEAYAFTRTYTIDANNGICYLRPADMAINNGSLGITAITNQYDSTVFQPTTSGNTAFNSNSHSGGFYYGSGFPTTAFKKAMFRIILSDGVYNASGYAFDIVGNPSQISIQSNNQVIFNSKPDNKTYYVKITKSSNNFLAFYPIKLESTNSWFTGYGTKASWTFSQWEAGSKSVNVTGVGSATNPEQYCALYDQKIPRLRDLGNFTYSLNPYLPNSTITSGWGDHTVTNNGYTRAMSSGSNIESGQGGVLTEWGRVRFYDTSSFANSWYWTGDYRDDAPNGTRIRFSYGVNQGNINYGYSAKKSGSVYYTMCVEDL